MQEYRVFIGDVIKTARAEKITITGYRTIRGKYLYLFRDEFGCRGAISRSNLMEALNSGAHIMQN